jgi:DNA-binding GntR family transcriptional regulator
LLPKTFILPSMSPSKKGVSTSASATRSAPKTSARSSARKSAASPIARGDGSSTVYQLLRERIVRGRLAPGTRLIEREVAIHLGVSRTPVRAALERLRQEGYIVGTGSSMLTRATVAPLTNDDAREIYQIVALIEGLAAREAATKPRALRLTMTRDMRDSNTQFRSAAQVRLPDADWLHDLDTAFHHRYVEVGAGPRLLTLHHAVKPQAERYGRIYTSTLVSEVATSAAEHDAIIKALEVGDPDGAERAVQTNWGNAALRLARVISTVGERGTW